MKADGAGFELDFVITAQHLVDFLRLRQRTLNRLGSFVALGLIVAGLYFAISGDRVLGAFEVIVGVLMLVTSQTTVFDAWRVKRAGRTVIGTRAHLTVEDDGMTIQNADMSNHIEWKSITELRINDRIVIPMRGRLPVGWLPTDAFASLAEREAAIAYMRDRITDADTRT
ncbi:MAG TPA: hypothetical protein VMZ33_07895 [Candidatus Limnocylindrales bacterium]|nr:hypothetical protein [Candidatus Limnocylindrales bacterium]